MKILVLTDFSDLSYYALDFAAQIAKPLAATVTLLHFEEIPLGDQSLHFSGEVAGGGSSGDSLFNAQLLRANKQKMASLVEEFGSDELEVDGRQYGGSFIKGLEQYIQQNGGDLVVIGTTGEESIQEFFSGNHTEQLIEHLDIPVLSLQHQQFHPIEDIVLGLDLKDHSYTVKAFEMMKVIVDPLNARLHIIDVTNSYDHPDLLAELEQRAKSAGLTNYTLDVLVDKDPNAALLDYADGTGAGLIVVLSEAQGGLYRFLKHSFAARLTKKSSIPVLTINNKQLNN